MHRSGCLGQVPGAQSVSDRSSSGWTLLPVEGTSVRLITMLWWPPDCATSRSSSLLLSSFADRGIERPLVARASSWTTIAAPLLDIQRSHRVTSFHDSGPSQTRTLISMRLHVYSTYRPSFDSCSSKAVIRVVSATRPPRVSKRCTKNESAPRIVRKAIDLLQMYTDIAQQ